METSSARPYFAVFAIVAILVAAFILKQEYASADQTPATAESAKRQLVKAKSGVDMVPEPIDDWFKRVGYQKLGFDSQDQMQATQAMLDNHNPSALKPEEKDLIRKLRSKPETADFGNQLVLKLSDSRDRKEFLPEVKGMYHEGQPNQLFEKIVRSWYNRGDRDLIVGLEKDPNKAMAEDVRHVIYLMENPGKP